MWLVGVVSKSWVWLVGVPVRRYIDFLILLIPTPLESILFCSSIPNFCSFFKMFFVFVQILFVIKFYVLKYFFRSINTHMGDYGHPTAAI